MKGHGMLHRLSCGTVVLIALALPGFAQSLPSFEVAAIKPATPGDRSGKFARMRSAHEFDIRNYSVKDLIVFAYDLPLSRISGGQSWSEGDLFNILAGTPGDRPPSRSEQMAMVRKLLEDRFQLRYHVQQR